MKNKLPVLVMVVLAAALAAVFMRLRGVYDFGQVEIVTAGYDPAAVEESGYLLLRPDWETTNCAQFAKGVCPENDFAAVYHFYVSSEDAAKLQKDAEGKKIKLVFSYREGFKPMVEDLFVGGKSYKKILNRKK